MTETLSGGCLCGAVRYTLRPGFRMKPYACHCTDCQRRTGSAFSSHMAVMEDDLTISGDLDEGSFVQPSGATSTLIGCTACKCRIYASNNVRPGVIVLRTGTLDGSKDMIPQAHFWLSSKQPWIVIPDDVVALDTQPDSPEGWIEILAPDP
ncbi:GFA family protein [Parasphingorhabdus sp.]|uniref:GFA family protein n=1 Tax=Parasphingorhabdus sp. TaxID=2709688 RepID=UPI003002613E